MRITADTNIYISALSHNGPPRTLLRLAASGDLRLALSDEIMDEIAETLRGKFGWSEARIAETRETLVGTTEYIVPRVILDVVKEDPDDNKILECAQTAHSDYIVTGDNHLLKLRHYDGMPIITVSRFLSQFRKLGAALTAG